MLPALHFFAGGFMEVADKIIVVTGGASGIGRAMVERFASDGAKKGRGRGSRW